MNPIVIVVVLLVLLLIGGVVLWFVTTSKPKPDPKPDPKPTPDPKRKPEEKEGCTFTDHVGQDSDGVPVCADPECKQVGVGLEECLEACCMRDSCVAAQYREESKRCLLKDAAGELAPAAAGKTLYEKN